MKVTPQISSLYLLRGASSLLMVMFLWIGCSSSPKEDKAQVEEMGTNTAGIDTLTPDTMPIADNHAGVYGLNEAQVQKVAHIHQTFYEVLNVTLSKLLADFSDDPEPEAEIEIWMEMAKAYDIFVRKNPALSIDQKDEAFNLLIFRSMMPEQEALDSFGLIQLSREKAKALLGNYKLEPDEVSLPEE